MQLQFVSACSPPPNVIFAMSEEERVDAGHAMLILTVLHWQLQSVTQSKLACHSLV